MQKIINNESCKLIDQIQNLQKEIEILKKENERLRNKFSKKENEITILRREIHRLRSQLTKLKNENNNKFNMQYKETISSMITNTNPFLVLIKNFLINGCKIPWNILDEKGDCIQGWRIKPKNGPPGFQKPFNPPFGWTAIGLKVKDQYDNGNNDWLGRDHSRGEWYIGFHGTKAIDSVHKIIIEGFRRGERQDYKDSPNLNPLTQDQYSTCDVGVYFTTDINEAKTYTKTISYLGTNFRVIFMCRINPYKVRIAMNVNNKEYWIVNGDDINDQNGRKRDDEVRAYRILIFVENVANKMNNV